MTWRDLLVDTKASVIAPWTGGRSVRGCRRTFQVSGRLPPEHGWNEFIIGGGRQATWWDKASEPPPLDPYPHRSGYLVGDWLLPDDVTLNIDPTHVFEQAIPIHLVEMGLERFARVSCAYWEEEKWVYSSEIFPLGPEDEVRKAYQDRATELRVPGVTPALHLAFLFETKRRQDVEEQVRKAAEERAKQERMANAARLMGTGEGRRELAATDMGAALRAALRVSGAELLDFRQGRNRNEVVVQYRIGGRRLECVVDAKTLWVISSGICLTDHDTGISSDTWLSLEALPGVVLEALRGHKLVVYRHVGDYDYDDEEYDDE